MEKKKYESAEIEIVKYDIEDSVLTSEGGNPTEAPQPFTQGKDETGLG